MVHRMLGRIHAVIGVTALGSLVLVAAPANAGTAPPAPTQLTVVPGTVVVKDAAGTKAMFSFRTIGGAPGSAKLVDSAGKTIDLKVTGGTNPGAGHTFTSGDRPGTWKLLATATKDGASTTAPAKTFEVHLATQVAFDVTPNTVKQGGEVTLQGSLRHWMSPAWKNYAGQKVFVSFKPSGAGSYNRVGSAMTDAQGRFSVKQKPSTTGWYRAVFEGNSTTEGSISREVLVNVGQSAGQSKDSRISMAARPQSVRAGSKVHLRGRLETGAANAWNPIKSTQVTLLFQEDGTSSWQRVTTASTAQDGMFDADVTANKSGWWRAEYAGSPDIKGSQAQVHVDVNGNRPPSDDGDDDATVDTRITRFKASPRTVDYGGKVRFKGKLQAYDDGWDSYGDQKVTLWFRSKQGWKKVKNAYTNDSGNFSIKVKARKSGYWKVLFGGNDEADGSSSKKKWVSVER